MSGSDPTPAMIERSEAWLKVVDTLEKYLNAASVRYDWINEATSRLSREMPQPEDLGEQFAPIGKGGIKDVFVKLWWDLNLPDGKAAESASKIIKDELLKEIDRLKVDLNRSIADFTEHSASFESPLAPSKTASLRDPQLHSKIDEYQRAVASAEAGKQPEIDPYLLKLQLDRRIDRAVRKHNAQADSYAYVQDAAKRVDAEVTERIQNLLKRYTDIVERNGNIIAEGGRSIRSVFVKQPQLFEYKHWLQSNKAPTTFVGSTSVVAKQRESDSDLGYPKEDSIYAQAVRVGTLERRSKILRTYSPGDYVLTPQSLIEMRQHQPVWSVDLIGAKLLENDKAATDDQFVLEARQHGSSSGKLHKFVFRAKVVANWKRDIQAICAGEVPASLTTIAKAQGAVSSVEIKDSEASAPTSTKDDPSKVDNSNVKVASLKTEPSSTQVASEFVDSEKSVTKDLSNKASTSAVADNQDVVPIIATSTVSANNSTTTPDADNVAGQVSGLGLNNKEAASFTSQRSVPESNQAQLASAASPHPVPTGILSSHYNTQPEATRTTAADDSDSDISEVDQGYEALNAADPEEHLNEQDTLAWRAKQDMAVFDKPIGAVGVEKQDNAAVDDDTNSVWSYDKRNKDQGNTFEKDTDFTPTQADLPVETERRLSHTTHKYEKPELDILDEKILQRRRSSVNTQTGVKRSNSRKATGSFGGGSAADLKPLTALSTEEKDALSKAGNDTPLVFADGLPPTTTGKNN